MLSFIEIINILNLSKQGNAFLTVSNTPVYKESIRCVYATITLRIYLTFYVSLLFIYFQMMPIAYSVHLKCMAMDVSIFRIC